jgi:hypothetical protein
VRQWKIERIGGEGWLGRIDDDEFERKLLQVLRAPTMDCSSLGRNWQERRKGGDGGVPGGFIEGLVLENGLGFSAGEEIDGGGASG